MISLFKKLSPKQLEAVMDECYDFHGELHVIKQPSVAFTFGNGGDDINIYTDKEFNKELKSGEFDYLVEDDEEITDPVEMKKLIDSEGMLIEISEPGLYYITDDPSLIAYKIECVADFFNLGTMPEFFEFAVDEDQIAAWIEEARKVKDTDDRAESLLDFFEERYGIDED